MKKLFFFLTLLCSFATTAQVVAGDVVQTFGNLTSGFNNRVYDMVVQPDGKTLVIGSFTILTELQLVEYVD